MKLIFIIASNDNLNSLSQFSKQLLDNELVIYIILFIDDFDPAHIISNLSQVTSLPIRIIDNNMQIKNDVIYIAKYCQKFSVSQHAQFTTINHFQNDTNYIDEILDLNCSSAELFIILLIENFSNYLIGLKRVKGKGGKIFFERPLDAVEPLAEKYSSIIDYYASIDDISEKLFPVIRKNVLENKIVAGALNRILRLLEINSGYKFSGYKENTIYRRIFRQMTLSKLENIEKYVELLETDQTKVHDLYKDLLIKVTGFFRDPMAFTELQPYLINAMKTKKANETFRVWIPGCSTGEEAYSLAVLLYEASREAAFSGKIQIFGTDIDIDALKSARLGHYPTSIENELETHWLENYFEKTAKDYEVKKFIRKFLNFGVHNIISDPPFTKLDLISCRNVFIYFNAQIQKQILPVLHYSLLPDGLLLLGMSETIGSDSDKFKILNRTYKIYQKININTFHQAISNFPVSAMSSNFNLSKFRLNDSTDFESTISKAVTSTLLMNYSPGALVVDEHSQILFNYGNLVTHINFNQDSRKVFIFDFLSESDKVKINEAMQNVKNSRNEININDITFINTESEFKTNLRIFPILFDCGSQMVYCLVFETDISYHQVNNTLFKYGSIAKLSKEIITRDNELHSTRQNLENLLEEQKTTNEELLSANEELLSMNEEVETSKEELLSLNEELRILNAELQVQIDKIVMVSTDVDNLFKNIDSIAIFVDSDLKIQRFTPKMQEILFIRPGDEGRYIFHFAQHFKNDNFMDDIRDVLQNHKLCTYEIQNDKDIWYQVCIMPYTSVHKVIEGIVITFFDITQQKNTILSLNSSYAELELKNLSLEKIFDTIQNPLFLLNHELIIKKLNNSALDYLAIYHDNLLNMSFRDICNGAFNQANIITFLLNSLKENSDVITKVFKVTLLNDTKQKSIVFTASRLLPASQSEFILLSMRLKDE